MPEDMRAELLALPDRLELCAALYGWAACGGDKEAFKEVFDRLAPKPRRLEHSGPGGEPIRTASVAAVASVDGDDAREFYMGLLATAAVPEEELDPEDDLLS